MCIRDSKYDPISQKEYYQFYAYFNINSDKGMQTRNGNSAPMIKVPTMMQNRELENRRAAVEQAKAERAKAKPTLKEMDEWIADNRVDEVPHPPALGGWQFLGSFGAKDSNEAFNKDYGPEKGVDLKKEHGGKKWEARKYEDGKVHTIGLPEKSASYFYRTVNSPTAQTVGVSLGSDDGIKVFLNGKQILANNANRGPAADQEKAELKLAKGENHLLIKIVNNGGQGGMYFKLGGSSLPQEVLANLGQDVLTPEH